MPKPTHNNFASIAHKYVACVLAHISNPLYNGYTLLHVIYCDCECVCWAQLLRFFIRAKSARTLFIFRSLGKVFASTQKSAQDKIHAIKLDEWWPTCAIRPPCRPTEPPSIHTHSHTQTDPTHQIWNAFWSSEDTYSFTIFISTLHLLSSQWRRREKFYVNVNSQYDFNGFCVQFTIFSYIFSFFWCPKPQRRLTISMWKMVVWRDIHHSTQNRLLFEVADKHAITTVWICVAKWWWGQSHARTPLRAWTESLRAGRMCCANSKGLGHSNGHLFVIVGVNGEQDRFNKTILWLWSDRTISFLLGVHLRFECTDRTQSEHWLYQYCEYRI